MMTEKYTPVKFLYFLFRLFVYLLIAFYLVMPFITPMSAYYPSKKFIKPKIKYQDIYLTTKDNVRINAWYIPAKYNKPTVIFCHGNAFNISYNAGMMSFLSEHHYGVMLFDYRGYGRSTGFPSEKGLYTDLNTVLDYLKKKHNITEDNIILWGHSLGSNLVVEAASKKQFKGVIIQGTSTSVRDMSIYSCTAPDAGFKIPLCKLLAETFIYYENYDNKSKFSKIRSPILILHGKKDELVPVKMAYILAEANPKSQLFIDDHGKHSTFIGFLHRVQEFIESL